MQAECDQVRKAAILCVADWPGICCGALRRRHALCTVVLESKTLITQLTNDRY